MLSIAPFMVLLWAGIQYEGALFADSRPDNVSMAAYEWTVLYGPDIDNEWIEWDRHALLVIAFGKQAQVSSLWPREWKILRHKEWHGGIYFHLEKRNEAM